MKTWAICLSLLLLPAIGTAGQSEQQCARELVEQGQILPLTAIIAHARTAQPGRILDVELNSKGGFWRYRLEMLDAQGQIWELLLDAHTGQVLERSRED